MTTRDQLLNDSEVALRTALEGNQAQLWTATPAIVQSVDLSAMTLSAQPSIRGLITSPDGAEQYVDMPLLVDVPICYPSAGGFSLTLPIAVGDEVLIVFASRCIDSWWQNGGIGTPMEARMHDLSDGFAIPGPRSTPRVLSGISSANAQLRSDDGTCFLEITPTGHINMTAPGGVKITGDLTVTGEVTAKSAGLAIPLSTHKHLGVTPGGGTSGGPTP